MDTTKTKQWWTVDVYQIRLKNLRLVINTAFDGIDANLARALGIAPNVLSRYFAPADAPHHRPVGTKMARRIEKAASKASGWMDHEHWPSEPGKIVKPKGAYTLPEDVIELALKLNKLSPDDRAAIEHFIRVKAPAASHQKRKRKT